MRALLLSMILLLPSYAGAVEPEVWNLTSAEEFLSGETEGFAVTALGQLVPGPAVKKLASFEDPFVLSQVAGDDGSLYFGTGNDGKVYRLRRGNLEMILDTEQQQIHALAIDGRSLYAGASPGGTIHRVDLGSSKSEVWAEVGEAYIWDIEVLADSALAVATGLEGKLMKVTRKGESSVLFDAPEMHLRAIAVLPDGTMIVGGSGEGRIYEISTDGDARALFDSPLTEISSLYHDRATSSTWAAGGTSALPTTPPQSQSQQQQQSANGQQNRDGSSQSEGEASVSVSFSFDDASQAMPPAQPTGSSELYSISRDGYVETVWKLDRQIIYSIDRTTTADGVVVSTGANGRVYRVRDGQVDLLAELPEKQVVSYRAEGGRAIVTTTNSGAVYELDFGSATSASYESPVKDTKRLSRFGGYRIEGHSLPRDVKLAWRSGNTSTPDTTWSDWRSTEGATGQIAAPAARYLQWRIEATRLAPGVVIEEVAATFVNRNAPPRIETFSVAEPAVVFMSSGYPASPGVVEATNPDQYGIFTSVEAPSPQDTSKKFFRKGFRTVNWKSSDPNGDTITHDLHFRRRSSENWLRLRENVRADQMNFDTSQLPDGEYELKITASDAPSNPVDPEKTERSGVFFTIDNTPPVIRSTGGARVTIEDTASPVAKVEYSIDAEEWKMLLPEDGISDSRSETYVIPGSTAGVRFVVVRAVDAFYNVATAAVE
ncbi:MAG: hypothetical protein KY432_01640 [Acidobacteria bacterium]|nr:hypothetical protein [Acidobacteriota bacterium]